MRGMRFKVNMETATWRKSKHGKVSIGPPVSPKPINRLEEIIINIKGSPTPGHVLPRGLSHIEDNIPLQHKGFLQGWHNIFAFSCLFALLVDPMFCYTLVLDDEKCCVHIDKGLAVSIIVFRSLTDLVYVLHIIVKFWFSFVAGYRAFNKNGTLEKKYWDRAKIILLCYLLVDIFAIAPLPQVILFTTTKSSGSLPAMIRIMKYVVIAQYVPRIVRLWPLHRQVMEWYGNHSRMVIVWAKSFFNLFLYVLASHVFGALWYLSALQRKASCWHEAYEVKGDVSFLDCNSNNEKDKSYLKEFCPINPPNATIYDFGMYLQALQFGEQEQKYSRARMFRKFIYSFLWGLQNLSSLGQSLKTSASIGEISFAVITTIWGLVLFALLIGNMQAFLLYGAQNSEQPRLKMEEIEHWKSFNSLPREMRKQIRKYIRRKNRGLDIQSLLLGLAIELSRKTKRCLCQDALFSSVPMLKNMEEQVLDDIYDCLKPVVYMEEDYIIREKDGVDKIIIVTHGLLYETKSSTKEKFPHRQGHISGHQLFDQALRCSSFSSMSDLPLSTITLQAHTEVEAFVLTASDLIKFVCKRRNLISTQLVDSPNSMDNLQYGAASAVQLAWRHYFETKHGTSKSRIQNGLAQEAAMDLRITTTMTPKFPPVVRNLSQRRGFKQSEMDEEKTTGPTSGASKY